MSVPSGLATISLAMTSANSDTPPCLSLPVTNVARRAVGTEAGLEDVAAADPMLSTNWLPVKAMSEDPSASPSSFMIDVRPVGTRGSGPFSSTSVTAPVKPRQNRPSEGCTEQGPAPPLPASAT